MNLNFTGKIKNIKHRQYYVLVDVEVKNQVLDTIKQITYLDKNVNFYANVGTNAVVEVSAYIDDVLGEDGIVAYNTSLVEVRTNALDILAQFEEDVKAQSLRLQILAHTEAAAKRIQKNNRNAELVPEAIKRIFDQVARVSLSCDKTTAAKVGCFCNPGYFNHLLEVMFPFDSKNTRYCARPYVEAYALTCLQNIDPEEFIAANKAFESMSSRRFNANDRAYDAASAESTLMSEEDLDSVRI